MLPAGTVAAAAVSRAMWVPKVKSDMKKQIAIIVTIIITIIVTVTIPVSRLLAWVAESASRLLLRLLNQCPIFCPIFLRLAHAFSAAMSSYVDYWAATMWPKLREKYEKCLAQRPVKQDVASGFHYGEMCINSLRTRRRSGT